MNFMSGFLNISKNVYTDLTDKIQGIVKEERIWADAVASFYGSCCRSINLQMGSYKIIRRRSDPLLVLMLNMKSLVPYSLLFDDS